jgi:alanine or glycine:cation symporter, AGCS family
MNIVEQLDTFFGDLSSVLWSWPLATILLGAGLIVTISLKFVQIRGFKHGLSLISGKFDKPEHEGAITHFQALSAALSATIGTGNIAGVATAIYWGGPGAIFWMWLTAAFGMALKFASCTLAQKYRKIDSDGNVRGGPMYYIEMGLGKNFKFLAIIFAIFTAIAAFGIGNMTQANSVANSLSGIIYGTDADNDLVFKIIVGLVMAFLVGLVIIGGIKRIGQVASRIVPLMCVFYVGGALFIIFTHLDQAADAISLIVRSAFNPDATIGGIAGSSIMLAIRHGVARGIFSNESGLGTAPMAHAAAKTDKPVREGLVAMLGPFIDTLIICTMTAIIIIIANDWTSIDGAELTSNSFEKLLPGFGSYIVSIGLVFFCFSTLISWSYYGEKGFEYLFGRKHGIIYRYIFLIFIPIGAAIKISLVWRISDVFNALMAAPNLIALLLLLPVLIKMTRDYFSERNNFKPQV